MMSDPTSVDKTTVDELTGKLVLVIEETRAWRETDLMHRQLAAKVKTYVRYARSPRFAADHGRSAQGTIVRIVSAQPPGQVSLKFFQRVAHELSKHGLQLEHQVGEDGFPESVTPSTEVTAPPRAPQAPPSARPTAAPSAGPPPAPRAPKPAAPEPRPSVAPPPPPPPPPPPDPWADDEPLEPSPPHRPLAEPIEPAQPPGLEFEPTFPAHPGDRELEPAAPGDMGGLDFEPPSELEQLIEGEADGIEFMGAREKFAPAAPQPPPGLRPDAATTHPPFFPEEEFGRALPDVDDVAAMGIDSEATTAVIETASGQRIRLDSPTALDDAIATPLPAEQGPSLLRAVGAAILGAFAGAIVWVLLAVLAQRGASPLALAVAIMVGFNVRLRGAGHTMPFRVVGILGTLFGSALGSVGASVALSAMDAGTGISGVMEMLSNKDAVATAWSGRYAWLDLFSLLLAGYLAFRISASKPS